MSIIHEARAVIRDWRGIKHKPAQLDASELDNLLHYAEMQRDDIDKFIASIRREINKRSADTQAARLHSRLGH